MGADKKGNFINGDEAHEHFNQLSRLDLKGFKNKSMLKVWPGMALVIYRHSEAQINPTLLAKLKVLELGFDEAGARAKLINLMTGQYFTVDHVPSLIPGFDIALCFPHRPRFERTIYIRENGSASYGTCAGLLVYHRNALNWSVAGQDCLESWMTIGDQFTDEGAFNREVENLVKTTLII